MVTKYTWAASKVFPGTVRDYWVYVPAQYKTGTAAAVMVWQDGAGYVKEDGAWRVPVVFDNLIHRGEMPVTIGIFIDPGVMPARSESEQARYHRSLEYDGMGDAYSRFLIEEILPEVGRSYTLTGDANLRAVGGSSSGGICAFTAAWHRPAKQPSKREPKRSQASREKPECWETWPRRSALTPTMRWRRSTSG